MYSVVVVVIFFLFLWIVLVKLDQSMDRPRRGGCSQLEEQMKSSRPPTPWIAAFCSLILAFIEQISRLIVGIFSVKATT
ncbi:hypothetical protein RHMOL_Rhmol07G0222700 [Rhododendron molle]|uniref:Uncharacterized protein n=1 Tax=Rhododendron molle TaxID=49168 RepID=A0ACC0N5D1_RHOML|nr:hypothetical protein RHMOL_Rhmol07G0222700 [Rhododendron molle]